MIKNDVKNINRRFNEFMKFKFEKQQIPNVSKQGIKHRVKLKSMTCNNKKVQFELPQMK